MLRFLIVGYGVMGVRHAQELRESGLGGVAAVYDADPLRRQVAAGAGFAVCDSLGALLDVPAECALVTTPNDTHTALACALLGSGRRVLVEKPAAMSADGLRRMYEAAGAAGKTLCVNQNRRWDRDFIGLRRVIDGGMLGRLTRLESRVQGSRGLPVGWRREKARGGGLLYDWGPHLVDQALLALGGATPEAVDCRMDRVLGYGVEDGFRLTLTYPGGLTAHIEAATCNYIAMPRFYLCGRDGTAMIDDWRGPCRVVQCASWDDGARGATGSTGVMTPRGPDTTRSFTLPLQPASRFEALRNFCAAVRGEEAPHVTRRQAMDVMRVLDAARASAAAERPVALKLGIEEWE